jgi:hypothetical protein
VFAEGIAPVTVTVTLTALGGDIGVTTAEGVRSEAITGRSCVSGAP